MQTPAYTVDVSDLPPTAHDDRSPVWWGNTLLMVIESTSMALLLATYLYTRQKFEHWPPPLSEGDVPRFALPDLNKGTVTLLALLVSVAPALYADRASRKHDRRGTLIGVVALCLLAVATLVMRPFEFGGLHFRFDDNAYGSLTWAILGAHYLYLWVGALEFLAVLFWIGIHGFDENMSEDVQLTAAYWYWTVGVGVVVYAVIYFAPRLL
jgi:heme/copper-type cytochrome/quinol oxidase subunit 3